MAQLHGCGALASLRNRSREFRRLVNRVQLQAMPANWTFELNAPNGFFAQLTWCLYLLAYCREHGRGCTVRLTSATYSDRPYHNWFDDFFVPAALVPPPSRRAFWKRGYPLRISHIQETDADRYSLTMTIEQAHALFNAHFRVNVNIQSYVDDFVSREFAQDDVIGLHFRGTDKAVEADPVDWSRCLRSVLKLSSDRPKIGKIFIASDDARFIDWICGELAGRLTVIVHPDEERSWDGQAVHYKRHGNNYKKGFDALVNCMLLSRCTVLVRTASFLSAWCSIFNPTLPITVLNAPHANASWFPDSECLKRSDPRYIAT